MFPIQPTDPKFLTMQMNKIKYIFTQKENNI